MFDIHRVELDWGGRKLTLETGKGRASGRRRSHRHIRRDHRHRHGGRRQAAEARHRLPAADRQLHREILPRAGRIPGGYFKRERGPTEKEHADLAPDRPPDPSAVRRRLALPTPR